MMTTMTLTTLTTTTTRATTATATTGNGGRRRRVGRGGRENSTRTRASTGARLQADDAIEWASVKAVVMELGMDEEAAEKAMGRAFGWTTQAYWRNTKVEEVPKMDEMEARIEYLNSIGLTTEKLCKVVNKCPEILGCDLAQLQGATEHIEKNFFMKRNTNNFSNYLVRVPQALGNNIDCAAEGVNCLGECNRCWARC
jgi:hypothetical protein